MRHPKVSRAFEVVSELPAPLRELTTLAFNLRWAWRPETRDVFRELDPQLWEETGHNPVQLISRLGPERLAKIAQSPEIEAKVRECAEELGAYLNARTWFENQVQAPGMSVAYFCAEFGLAECLPIYSGGLGVLAGDVLKAASDLGLPLVGVGLLYSRGYFRQSLDQSGWQQERYPEIDFYKMPIRLMRDDGERPLRVEVEMPDRSVTCQIWKAEVGRVPLYLLDSNVLENAPTDQGITDTLYGGDEEMRIRQEMILGIGGMRALEALGIKPTVCHMNEGHSAFLAIERIRQFMAERGCDFRTARQTCVSGNVFTTHTPVPAGFDVFSAPLLEKYLARTAASVGLNLAEFSKLGRIEPQNEGEPFNMAVLAMENSNHVNAVSKLHARVSRAMFSARWPEYSEEDVPIEAITNGVHLPTWTSRRMARLMDRYLGREWRLAEAPADIWQKVWDIPDAELWRTREDVRGDLVRFVRKRLQRVQQGQDPSRQDFGQIGGILDPRVLTIGFARRFATYKRASLILSDKERLKAILFHPERPVQIVLAGKAHPRDDGGKGLIQELVRFIQAEGAGARMVFLEDYDMGVARALVQGVDVWLNNPRRPLEASGTSGMKAVPNGGLNCSILDGWWDEAYRPGVGWAIGDEVAVEDQAHRDWLESRSLYGLIEREIAPRFYHRVDGGVPVAWCEMMKRSIAELAPGFSSARMTADYALRFYVPASLAYERLSAGSAAKDAIAWRERVKAAWPKVRVVSVSDSGGGCVPVGGSFEVRMLAELGGLQPSEVRAQVVVGQIGPNQDLVDGRVYDLEALEGVQDGPVAFSGVIPCPVEGHRGYTTRILPRHELVSVPHELPMVAWQ